MKTLELTSLSLVVVAAGAWLAMPMRPTTPSPAVTTAAHDRVAPGLVHWHVDFDAACRASAVSGRPVLLFQLLGRLDEEFC